MSLLVSLQSAGYGTRFGEETPKALLPLGSGVILDHVIDWVGNIADGIYISVNQKFEHSYREWAKGKGVKILVEGHKKPHEDIAGSVGGIQNFVKYLEERRATPDKILLAATDELFGFSCADFTEFQRTKDSSVVLSRELDSLEEARSYGIVCSDSAGRVLKCEERPKNPRSKNALHFCYIFTRSSFPHISSFRSRRKDAAADMVDYAAKHVSVFEFPYPKGATYFHITDDASYRAAKEFFERAG